MSSTRVRNGVTEKLVFSMYITVKGQRVRRKNGRPFAFWVPVDKD